MHLLFLDESGRIDQDRLFALGGVMVQDVRWGELRDTWHATLTAHGWPLDRELKWHGVRQGSVPPALGDAVFEALARAPITCLACLVDLQEGRRQHPPETSDWFRTDADTYATALMLLAERFQRQLETVDDVGILVADSRHREDDDRLRRFFGHLQKDGTPYMRLDRIIETLFLEPSHYSIGLQCADLIIAATAAAERGVGQGRGYFGKLEPRFARHPATGAVDGVGIKRVPSRTRGDDPSDRLFYPGT